MPAPPLRSRNRKPATARPLEILALFPLKFFVCSAIGDAILVALSCPRRPRASLAGPTSLTGYVQYVLHSTTSAERTQSRFEIQSRSKTQSRTQSRFTIQSRTQSRANTEHIIQSKLAQRSKRACVVCPWPMAEVVSYE
jgi:hypothetical protein